MHGKHSIKLIKYLLSGPSLKSLLTAALGLADMTLIADRPFRE
jgi:hypothetical protein